MKTVQRGFLFMQSIHGGKTQKNPPQFKLGSNANPKHFSNTYESIKAVDEMVLLCAKGQLEKIENSDQAALLRLPNIYFVTVSINMKHLSLNGICKKADTKVEETDI